jgi:predicted RNA-binding protein with PIN domain
MSVEILIDGYNLIFAWPEIKNKFMQNPDEAREYLASLLSNYRKIKHNKIKLIFDAYNTYNFSSSGFGTKGISIVFTGHGETADEYIKRTISSNGEKFIVVSSDNEIKRFALNHNAVAVKSEEFIDKLELAFLINEKGVDIEEDYQPKIHTKKKGNPKKLPKKIRKKINKLKKL